MPIFLRAVLETTQNKAVFKENLQAATLNPENAITNPSRILNRIQIPDDFRPNVILKSLFPKEKLPTECLNYTAPHQGVGERERRASIHEIPTTSLIEIIEQMGEAPGKRLLDWCYLTIAVAYYEIYETTEYDMQAPVPAWFLKLIEEGDSVQAASLAGYTIFSFLANVITPDFISQQYPLPTNIDLDNGVSVLQQLPGLLSKILETKIIDRTGHTDLNTAIRQYLQKNKTPNLQLAIQHYIAQSELPPLSQSVRKISLSLLEEENQENNTADEEKTLETVAEEKIAAENTQQDWGDNTELFIILAIAALGTALCLAPPLACLIVGGVLLLLSSLYIGMRVYQTCTGMTTNTLFHSSSRSSMTTGLLESTKTSLMDCVTTIFSTSSK